MPTSGADPAPQPQHQMTNNGMDAILAGFASIQQALGEFRVEAARNQTELEELRARFEEVLTATGDSDQPPRHNEAQPLSQPLPTPTPLSTLTYTTDAAVKLYPLPQFDGKPEEWPLFYANFRDSTNELGYDNKRNLMRLHKALVGEARRTVASLLIYPDDVPKAMDELKFNFGRPELLVRSQLEKLRQFPMIGESRLEQVLTFANQLRNVVALFKSAGCRHQLANFDLLEQLVLKLPPSKQFEWSRYAANIVPYATVEHLTEWVADLARVVSLMPPSSQTRASGNANRQPAPAVPGTVPQSAPRQNSARRIFHNNEVQPRQNVNCLQCGQQHELAVCRQFQSRDLKAKWSLVKGNRLCFGCLRAGHNLATCQQRKNCAVNGCTRQHHESLHQAASPANPAVEVVAERVLNCLSNRQSSLFKILPVILSGPDGALSVYAMFDEGSSLTLLEDYVAVKLGLRGQNEPLTLQWYGSSQTKEKSRRVAVNIRGEDGVAEFHLRNVRTIKSLNLPQQTFRKEQYSHLKSLPLTNYINARPVILIGLDNSYLGVAKETIQAGPDEPVAAATQLGWVAYGPLNKGLMVQPRLMHVRESQSLQKLQKLVQEYFSIEGFGVRSTDVVLESDENRRAKAILTETTKDLGKQYEVGLLWREDKAALPSSYDMAFKRLMSLEARMAKDVTFAANYRAEINKYLEKGYARLLPQQVTLKVGATTWYLPHFGVVNPHKPNKLRVVFDAAASVSKVSLNSALLKGPEHAQPLIAIMHKFRQGTIAVAADIQEMFSQVAIKPADQDSQRFLWRDGDPTGPVQTYAMSTMIFGAICSPCCAEYIKNINADKFESSMPRGVAAVVKNMYVDDLVISFNNQNEAAEVTNETITINAAAGFKLRRFISNDKTLQAELCAGHGEAADVVNMERNRTTDKVLGFHWNTVADSFEFHIQFHKIARDVLSCSRPPTKREFLGIVMAIYDPFGFLANITVCMKILMQSLWKRQIEWDDPLPHQLHVQWSSWWKGFQDVTKFSVPRCYSPLLALADEIQLHVFVDASSSAYAAVAYLRIVKRAAVDVAFVAAKARCAPLKGMTIPRLELQAAVLGCRLEKSIRECHDFAIHRVVFWSDSKTVLLWIRSTTREYKQFVAARIAEILTSTQPPQWRWLPTALNVADDATRAKQISAAQSNCRWIKGPEFLRQHETEWPVQPSQFTSDHCATEEKKDCLLLMPISGEYVLNFAKFSSFLKLLRVMSWVLRFAYNARNRCRRSGELTAAEISCAENGVCRRAQEEAYGSELELLRKKQQLPKSSPLYQLTPMLDNDGLIKVNGRIDAAFCLPISARRPIIMPQHHHVTRLIVRHWHLKLHHQNDCLTMNEIRQRFWVPHIRTVVKSVKKRCHVCIANRAKPSTPLMGQLPVDRLTPYIRPFSYTGVDYCGPFVITIGRRHEKRWVALFTCLTVRAVHIEVAEDLSTDAFLVCLRNFVNRRGVPVRLRSDNGTNFIGAQKILHAERRLWDFDRIEQDVAKQGIEWLFNCPANPSAGGCWERLIQCVKRLLQRVLNQTAPRLETFRSVLIEAENIVNSRPLTDIPVSPQDEHPLTPNHFLLGCLNSTQTPSQEEETVCLRKQWRIVQALKDRLWKRWTSEYLPSLLRRSKWRENAKPLQPGQLVIVCDSNQPRNQWVKGTVTEVYMAKDGQVRSAEVRTSHGVVRRPASKLAALEICESL